MYLILKWSKYFLHIFTAKLTYLEKENERECKCQMMKQIRYNSTTDKSGEGYTRVLSVLFSFWPLLWMFEIILKKHFDTSSLWSSQLSNTALLIIPMIQVKAPRGHMQSHTASR